MTSLRIVSLALVLSCCACHALAASLEFSASALSSVDDDPFGGENSVLSATYDGPDVIFTEAALTATLTSQIQETFGEEALLFIINVTRGYQITLFTNNVDDEFTALEFTDRRYGAFAFAGNGDQFALVSVEDLDDGPGEDALWTDFSLLLTDDRPIEQLGQFAPGAFTIEASTNTQDFSMVAGLYDAAGSLVAELDDDDATIDAQLAPGEYFLVLAGDETFFTNHAASISIANFVDSGAVQFVATINGQAFPSGALALEGPSFVASFTVVPEPAAAALSLIGAGVLFRRRRLSILQSAS